MPPLILEPIGVVRSPFSERAEAPRQPAAARGVPGRIELLPGRGFEDALCDLEEFSHVWVIFWFHLNAGWRPKVLPPRSEGRRRGVFSTRSPHRPNPIGMSAVALERVDAAGLTVHVRDLDLVDGTPVLDLKPYLPYADAIAGAGSGWLDEGRAEDPRAAYEVAFSEEAAAQLGWLRDEGALDLAEPIRRTLSLGPQPHAYRRIRRAGDAFQLAVKAWRATFVVEERRVTVLRVTTGYRPRDLALGDAPELALHRAFVARFGLG